MTAFVLACYMNGALQGSIYFKSINDCNYYKEGLNNQEFEKGGEPQLYKCICKLVPSIDPNKIKIY